MDIVYPPEAQKLAAAVRKFVRAQLPAATREKVLRQAKLSREEHVDWQLKLCERGWACAGWPKTFGGPGFTPIERHVFDNTIAEEGAPTPNPFGEGMIAPVLFAVGSDEQKAEILPRIRTLEFWFCQGFSEPGAGSDLASLKTRATRDGDEWIISGQKTWTSYAHFANMMFCLVRTDSDVKPQAGISMMVFPMSLPGISVRPIITMDGSHSVNEVFFDDVRVPACSLIGEVNKGWSYAKLLLGHERTGIAGIGMSKRLLRQLKQLAASQTSPDGTLLADPVFRNRIAALEIDLLSLEITALRALSENSSSGIEASVLKVKGTEIRQALTELCLDAAGPYVLPFDPARGIDVESTTASLAPAFLEARALSIYGGSNEIQHNIVAKWLGL
jgi:alkylation response protein AidB-like acyl-CoA dehydrogenase